MTKTKKIKRKKNWWSSYSHNSISQQNLSLLTLMKKVNEWWTTWKTSRTEDLKERFINPKECSIQVLMVKKNLILKTQIQVLLICSKQLDSKEIKFETYACRSFQIQNLERTILILKKIDVLFFKHSIEKFRSRLKSLNLYWLIFLWLLMPLIYVFTCHYLIMNWSCVLRSYSMFVLFKQMFELMLFIK